MDSKARPFSSLSRSPIDIVDLFNAPARSSKTKAAIASSSSSSSLSPSQQITLSSVLYNVELAIAKNGESELCFEAANGANRTPTPESWKLLCSADASGRNYCCCFSADSMYFITGIWGDNHSVRLWNPSTRVLVTQLTGHTADVNAVTSFRLNGKIMVASASDDKTIRIWELKDPASSSVCVTTLAASSAIYALTYSSKQNVLISGQYDKTIMFWSPSNWQCIQTLSSSSYVCAMSLSSDESKLASGHGDGSINVWDTASGTEINTWKTANRITRNGLCFSPSQPDILVAAATDGTCTWNCATGFQIRSIASQSGASFIPCSFSPDGKYFATVSFSKQLILVDAATNSVVKTLDGSPVGHISSACFSPDGQFLACATNDSKSFYIWESTPSSPQKAVTSRSIVPDSASDFRLVPLSDSTCLAIVRLDSGEHTFAVALVKSTPSTPVIHQWTSIANAMMRPVVSLVAADGRTLKVEDKNPWHSTSIPIFIGDNAGGLAYAAALGKLAQLEAANEDLMQQVAAAKEEAEQSKQEASKRTAAAVEVGRAKQSESQPTKAEASALLSYLVKQENGMDEVLLELSFAYPGSDASSSPLFQKCKSILEGHLSSTMAELRSMCSSSPSTSLNFLKSAASGDDSDIVSEFIDWNSLRIGEEIGHGGFGSVFACEVTTADGETRSVALKVPARTSRETLPASVQKPSQDTPSITPAGKAVLKSIQNEIATYKRIDHPNVVRYLGSTVESSSSSICIIQQYCASGDLQSLLSSTPMCAEKFAFQTAIQIVSGMSAVHNLGVVHRDLKPANVLLCSFAPSSTLTMTICKVTDCGSAALKDLNSELSRITGNVVSTGAAVNGFTPRYRPPELLNKKMKEQWKNSYAQDLWAFGLLLFQLRTGKIPFADAEDDTVGTSIVTGEEPGEWPEADGDSWDWLRALASQCLELQPRDRLAHFEAMGASADGRTAFAAIEKKLCEARPEWAKEVMANMLKFQRMEIRDPFLKDQMIGVK